MPFIKTIMVAIDFSKYSKPIACYADQLARDLSADLLFVNVISRHEIDIVQATMAAYPGFNADHFLNERISTRARELTELVNESRIDSGRSRQLVRVGIPYQELLDVIDAESPDLLVMGTIGRGENADVAAGSCARMLHRRSPIALLSIRGDKVFDLTGKPSPELVQR